MVGCDAAGSAAGNVGAAAAVVAAEISVCPFCTLLEDSDWLLLLLLRLLHHPSSGSSSFLMRTRTREG